METIHVVFCIRDERGTYIEHTTAAIASVLAHTETPVAFHILCDDTVLAENREKLYAWVSGRGAGISFHDFGAAEIDAFRGLGARVRKLKNFNIGTLYRFFIPKLLADVEKVIYLDSDVIVNLDLRELWRTELVGCLAAAVRDRKETRKKWTHRAAFSRLGIDYRNYFNAGVLLLDLDALRSEGDFARAAMDFFARHSEILAFADQDVLNALLRGRIMLLPERFNFIPFGEIPEETLENPALLIHFAGAKPWNVRATPLDYLYWRYFMETPWNENTRDTAGRISRLEATADYSLLYGGGYVAEVCFCEVLQNNYVRFCGSEEFHVVVSGFSRHGRAA